MTAVDAGEQPRVSAERSVAGARVFCILGKSRSGTSLTARVLNLLGVSLGPSEALMPPAANNNPKGFWEHQGIAMLDEEILAALCETPPQIRQAWRWPPPLDEGWEHDPRLEPQRAAARLLLRESFAGEPVWGWKDPRTCLTLPFWRQLVPALRYVICVRHPLDVAASLAARDAMDVDEALRLWQLYTSHAVLNTLGAPRLVVSYESYFPAWEAQAERLARFVGAPGLSPAQRGAIAEHCEPGLWHHREGPSLDVALPPETAALYDALTELAAAPAAAPVEAEQTLDAIACRIALTV